MIKKNASTQRKSEGNMLCSLFEEKVNERRQSQATLFERLAPSSFAPCCGLACEPGGANPLLFSLAAAGVAESGRALWQSAPCAPRP